MMTEEERERTMNFILEQQAHSAAGMQKFEAGIQRLERDLVLMARQFRRERHDLRERVAALADAQIKSEGRLARSEDRLANSEQRLTRIEEMMERSAAGSEARLTRIEELTERNSEDIRALARFVSRDGGKQNGGADDKG